MWQLSLSVSISYVAAIQLSCNYHPLLQIVKLQLSLRGDELVLGRLHNHELERVFEEVGRWNPRNRTEVELLKEVGHEQEELLLGKGLP